LYISKSQGVNISGGVNIRGKNIRGVNVNRINAKEKQVVSNGRGFFLHLTGKE